MVHEPQPIQSLSAVDALIYENENRVNEKKIITKMMLLNKTKNTDMKMKGI